MTIISHEHKFVFIHLHKTGGTSFELAYEPHTTYRDIIIGSTEYGENIQGKYYAKYGLGKHSSASDVLRVLGSDVGSYDFISLVREPTDRLRSLFKWIRRVINDWAYSESVSFDEAIFLLQRGKRNPEFITWEPVRIVVNQHNPLSFAEFVITIANTFSEFYPVIDAAVHPMIERLYGVKLSYVFKLENVADLYKWLSERVGYDIPVRHDNFSSIEVESQFGSQLDLSLTDESARRILNLYRSDFVTFDYSAEELLHNITVPDISAPDIRLVPDEFV